jgi:transketolase
MTTSGVALDQLCINTVRTLAMDAVQRAESGHPGTPMALAPLCYVLWTKHLRYNPKNPQWPGRDRFVLSCGHASMLLYSLLYLTGYDLSLDELKQFRQWGSRTPGHPEYGRTPGVETTTGPLGQGFGNAVGMALARARLASEFNRPGHDILNHTIYVLASDGDMMEGVSHEAASLAGHLKLGNLIAFYDDNHITIDGPTTLAFSDDTAKRFAAYGWRVQRVDDGNDLAALNRAIRRAQRVSDRPALIIVRTHIAYGSPHKQDTAAAHGSPLGVEEVKLTKQNLGWPYAEPFTVPDEALAHWRRAVRRGKRLENEWRRAWDAYAAHDPELGRELERRLARELPPGWDAALPDFAGQPAMATRAASGKVLNAVAPRLPELIGGSGDLTPSNDTFLAGAGDFGPEQRGARNLHFGVREHAMGAVLNGMALHSGLIPYGGTFLVFSDYMRPPIRLAAMMGLRVIYVFTHDSIGLGEDGPTHQPIEQLAGLRSVPNLIVIRPADAGETAEAWRTAIAHRSGPVALVLTRQKLPVLDRGALAPAAGLSRGAYVLAEATGGAPRAVLLASGSEVEIALAARTTLEAGGVAARVVSAPSLELLAEQPASYRDQVIPPDVPCRVAVEAAQPQPWYRWVGSHGDVVGLTRFGASAPYQRVYEELGITADAVVQRVQALLAP